MPVQQCVAMPLIALRRAVQVIRSVVTLREQHPAVAAVLGSAVVSGQLMGWVQTATADAHANVAAAAQSLWEASVASLAN